MEEIKVIEVLYMLFAEHISTYAVPVAAVIAVATEWFKRKNKENQWVNKKYMVYLAAGVSLVASVALVLLSPLTIWPALFINFAAIFFGEIAIDIGLIKPFIDLNKKD